MKLGITARFLFALLTYGGNLSPGIFAKKNDLWDQIDTLKKNTSTFSFQCQDQMVQVESQIFHLNRLRTSLKSGYFEKLFTSDDFKQKNYTILKIQLKNGEVFPAIVDLIHGKELTDILRKDNYFPLLKAMDHLEMEIDLQTISNFMDENLKSHSLRDAKVCELYEFIRENSNFEYLFGSVFKHFANNLATLQNHSIFPSLPLDHLIWIINNIEHPDDEKRYEIIQICTEWLCHDMETRIFHMANLVTSIKSVFHSSIETSPGISKCFPKCAVDEQTKRKIISRCVFALLANSNLDPKKIDELKSGNNSKSFSPRDTKIFEFYNFVKNDSELEHHLESIFKSFAKNLTTLQNHEIFLHLPHDHLIRIIKNIQKSNDKKRYDIIQMCTEWLCHDMENRLPHLGNLVTAAKFLFVSTTETNSDISKCLPKCNVDQLVKRKIISKCLCVLLADVEKLNLKILTDDESNYHSDDGYNSEDDGRKLYNVKKCIRFIHRNNEDKLKKFLNNGDFYDITLRIGEKAYKLHRAILELKCGHFRDYFQAEYTKAVAQCRGIPTCPSKDDEYSLSEEVDSSTFGEVIVDYIYFDNFERRHLQRSYNIIRIFKAVDTLEVLDQRLLENCKQILMDDYHFSKFSAEDAVQILNYTHGKPHHDDLYLLHLSRHMTAKWPEIYNVSHFCSISWTMLENMCPGLR